MKKTSYATAYTEAKKIIKESQIADKKRYEEFHQFGIWKPCEVCKKNYPISEYQIQQKFSILCKKCYMLICGRSHSKLKLNLC